MLKAQQLRHVLFLISLLFQILSLYVGLRATNGGGVFPRLFLGDRGPNILLVIVQ